MKAISEKVAYLQGLAEGLGINEETAEGKMIGKILEVLEDVSDALLELDDAQAELDDYVSDIDEDLAEVEEELFGEDCDGDCEDFDEEDFLEIECPKCHEIVYFDQNALAGGDLICPVCNQSIFEDVELGKE